MKRIVLLIVIALLAAIVIKGPDSLIGLAKMSRSASDNGGSLPNVTGKATGVTGKKVLVAYFSWGGNTREVAKLIHSKTGGDLIEIKRKHPIRKNINRRRMSANRKWNRMPGRNWPARCPT